MIGSIIGIMQGDDGYITKLNIGGNQYAFKAEVIVAHPFECPKCGATVKLKYGSGKCRKCGTSFTTRLFLEPIVEGGEKATVSEKTTDNEIRGEGKASYFKSEAGGEIKVGDEVRYKYTDCGAVWPTGNTFVIKKLEPSSYIDVIDEHGQIWALNIDDIEKTGRHFPQIAEVLGALRSEN